MLASFIKRTSVKQTPVKSIQRFFSSTPMSETSEPVQDQVRPKKTQVEYMFNGALPLDRAGTIALPKLAQRDLVQKFMDRKSIEQDVLLDHLQGLFQDFLVNASKGDMDKI